MSFQKNTKKRGRKPEKDGYSTLSDIERKKYHHKVVKEFRGDDPSTILLTTSTSSPYTLKKKSWLATHHWSYCNDSNNIEESKKVHYESKTKTWKLKIDCASLTDNSDPEMIVPDEEADTVVGEKHLLQQLSRNLHIKGNANSRNFDSKCIWQYAIVNCISERIWF